MYKNLYEKVDGILSILPLKFPQLTTDNSEHVMDGRPYDLVVYGASGFTGQFVVAEGKGCFYYLMGPYNAGPNLTPAPLTL